VPARFKNALNATENPSCPKVDTTRCALSFKRAYWIFEDQQVDGLLTYRMGDISQTVRDRACCPGLGSMSIKRLKEEGGYGMGQIEVGGCLVQKLGQGAVRTMRFFLQAPLFGCAYYQGMKFVIKLYVRG